MNWTQRQVDLGTIVLYSAADVGLLLVNEACRLGLEPANCTARTVRKALVEASEPLDHLDALFRSTSSVTFPRHMFVHRAQERPVDVFTSVRRAQQLTAAVGVPMRGVTLNVVGAKDSAESLLAGEIALIAPSVDELVESLAPSIETSVAALGGIEAATREEMQRCAEAIMYFRGGEKPQWMDE